MADEDSLFGLDIVRDFILSRGGKTTNHALVTHFKTFLNNPKWKNQNRQKFKDIVNTLATVKLDESGEKVLVLKKKYRDGATSQSLQTPASSAKELPRNRPKAKKAKLAEQFESSVLSEPPTPSANYSLTGAGDLSSPVTHKASGEESPLTEPDDSSPSLHDMIAGEPDDSGPPLNEPDDSGPSLSDMIAGELGAFGLNAQGSAEALDEQGRSRSPTPTPPSPEVEEASVSDISPIVEPGPAPEVLDVPAPHMAMVEDDIVPEEPPVAEPVMENVPEAAAAGAALVDDGDGSIGADSGVGEGSELNDMDGMSVASSGADSMLSTPAPSKRGSLMEERSVSVRARAQHLNKIESLSNLHGAAGKQQSKAAGAEDEDSTSETSITITLTDIERKWMVDAAQANYQELAKALNNTPKLAHYMDFMSGYTALHWAAKHGNSDIIKLLCGTKETVDINEQTHGGYTALHLASIQGHEDIIELLVQGYRADPDMRDHSGRKAKQYLKHSASTRSQQLLQPRRIHTGVVSNTNQTSGFRRMGSYNSKIRSVGGAPFGIQGGVAMRKSWTSSSVEQMRSLTPSPNASPRDSPATLRRIQSDMDQDMMPPPQGIPIRRQRSKRGDSRENLSDSELPQPSYPVRTGSDSNLMIQSETGV